MARKYKHIFFDLDHTLWDFDKNSEIALKMAIQEFGIDKVPNFSFETFFAQFKTANYELWDLFSLNKISSEELRNLRFLHAFDGWDFDKESIKNAFNEAYLMWCPIQGHLMENTKEVLEYLFERYELHVLTNGFEHIQYTKMITSDIFHYFQHVVTAKDTNGVLKPNPAFFHYAVKLANAEYHECIMIGDTPHVDVVGAQAAGIDTILYNPSNKSTQVQPNHEISSLKELLLLF